VLCKTSKDRHLFTREENMSDKKQITEETGEHEAWYQEAEKQTLATSPEFLSRLANNYSHDYGTICHAIAASGLAAMYAMNESPQGGITGFQGSCVMWEFIRRWGAYKSPLRLVDYGNMLYPQYEDKFQKTIPESAWEYLQKEAANNLEKKTDASQDVINHWKSILEGVVPFGYVIERSV
jgi:hypothetical protein